MGLEPTQPQWPRDFKSLVSTDSTIRAAGICRHILSLTKVRCKDNSIFLDYQKNDDNLLENVNALFVLQWLFTQLFEFRVFYQFPLPKLIWLQAEGDGEDATDVDLVILNLANTPAWHATDHAHRLTVEGLVARAAYHLDVEKFAVGSHHETA